MICPSLGYSGTCDHKGTKPGKLCMGVREDFLSCLKVELKRPRNMIQGGAIGILISFLIWVV